MKEYGKLLPTPNTGSNRNSRGAILDLKGGGKHKSDLSLEQALEVSMGILPKELEGIQELPPQYRISTSSPGVSLASPSPALESEKERQTIAISGRRCYESLERFGLDGSLARMSLALLTSTTAWYSRTVALRWKLKGTRFNRLYCQLAPSTRRTGGTECGFVLDAKKIITTDGKDVLIDAEDYPRVVEAKWTTYGNDYVQTKINSKTVLLHRFLMDAPKGMDVDHINHNPLDNRKRNLRLVPHYINTHNRKRRGGVHLPKGRHRWKAIIYVNNQRTWLGQYPTEEEARKAYEQAKEKYGLNVPSLSNQIAMLPTPNTPRPHDTDKTAGEYYPSQSQYDLTTVISGQKTGTPLRLEPAFVEYMMGYPEGWTELTD